LLSHGTSFGCWKRTCLSVSLRIVASQHHIITTLPCSISAATLPTSLGVLFTNNSNDRCELVCLESTTHYKTRNLCKKKVPREIADPLSGLKLSTIDDDGLKVS